MLLKLNKMISLNLRQFIIITVGIICTAICNVAYSYSLKYIFNELANKNIKQLSIILMTILSVLIIQATISFIVSRFLSKIVQTYLFEKKLKLFDYMLSVDFQDEREKFQTIINSDFEQLGQQIVNFFILIIYYSTLILSYISALFSLNAKLTLVLLLTVPLILCTNIILGIYIQKIYFKSKQYLDAVNKNIVEFISGNLIIKAFSAQQYIFKKFSINNKLLKKNNIYYDTLQAFSNSCVALFSIVAPFIVLSIGIIYVLKKEMSIGTLIAIYTFAGAIFSPISNLMQIIPLKKEMDVSIKRINDYFKKISELQIVDNYNGTDCVNEIKIDNLTFGYDRDLGSVSISIKNGIYFIDGPNGSGKSTFLKTLANLIPKKKGKIYLGKDIKKILYVPNDAFVFDGTVNENIIIGLNKYSKKEYSKIAKILDLNLKIDDIVKRDNKVLLSTGQIQKIKIIRTLLDRKNNIIILDELISNLNEDIQNNLYEYLNTLSNSVIIIVDHNMPAKWHKSFTRIPIQ